MLNEVSEERESLLCSSWMSFRFGRRAVEYGRELKKRLRANLNMRLNLGPVLLQEQFEAVLFIFVSLQVLKRETMVELVN